MKPKRRTATSGMDWNVMLGLTHRLLQDKLYRDYLLVFAGCHWGLRISDLLSLRWSDVLGRDELIMEEQKTGKQRRITINPKVDDALRLCSGVLMKQGKFKPEGYVFANRWNGRISISYINKRLKYIFKKYDVKVQNPSSHTLIKSFGKRVWEADNQSEKSLVYLSEIFSHSSIATTKKYIGITQEHISNIYLTL